MSRSVSKVCIRVTRCCYATERKEDQNERERERQSEGGRVVQERFALSLYAFTEQSIFSRQHKSVRKVELKMRETKAAERGITNFKK